MDDPCQWECGRPSGELPHQRRFRLAAWLTAAMAITAVAAVIFGLAWSTGTSRTLKSESKLVPTARRLTPGKDSAAQPSDHSASHQRTKARVPWQPPDPQFKGEIQFGDKIDNWIEDSLGGRIVSVKARRELTDLSLTAWEAIDGFSIDPSKSVFEILEEKIYSEWMWPKLGTVDWSHGVRHDGTIPIQPESPRNSIDSDGDNSVHSLAEVNDARGPRRAVAPTFPGRQPQWDIDLFSTGMNGEILVPEAGAYRFSMMAPAFSMMTIGGEPLSQDSDGAHVFHADLPGWYRFELRIGAPIIPELYWDFGTNVGNNPDFPSGRRDLPGPDALVPPTNLRPGSAE
jgi:hypothetical protein